MLATRRPTGTLGLEIALGWHVTTEEGRPTEREFVWHNGGTGGFSSFVGFCPQTRVGIVVLANSEIASTSWIDAARWRSRSRAPRIAPARMCRQHVFNRSSCVAEARLIPPPARLARQRGRVVGRRPTGWGQHAERMARRHRKRMKRQRQDCGCIAVVEQPPPGHRRVATVATLPCGEGWHASRLSLTRKFASRAPLIRQPSSKRRSRPGCGGPR
jgi:Beta-lactamase